MTQPLMYNLIEAKRSVRKLYTEALIAAATSASRRPSRRCGTTRATRAVFAETRETASEPPCPRTSPRARPAAGPAETPWRPRRRRPRWTRRCSSGSGTRRSAAGGVNHPPEAAVADGAAGGDGVRGRHRLGVRGAARLRSVLMEGTLVRLAGQDSRRGTSPAAAVLTTSSPARSGPRCRTCRGPGEVLHLRLAAVRVFAAMGFEYGYSGRAAGRPGALEAQFGDFQNGAQTIIDEFVSSSSRNGVSARRSCCCCRTVRGPGTGPLSDRIERYLQLCAERNLTWHSDHARSYFHCCAGRRTASATAAGRVQRSRCSG